MRKNKIRQRKNEAKEKQRKSKQKLGDIVPQKRCYVGKVNFRLDIRQNFSLKKKS